MSYICCCLAGLSGWLYAHFQRAANPTPFGAQAGIEYLFIAVVGGAGYVWGAVLGAAIVVVLKEILQAVPSFSKDEAQLEKPSSSGFSSSACFRSHPAAYGHASFACAGEG